MRSCDSYDVYGVDAAVPDYTYPGNPVRASVSRRSDPC